MTAPPRRAGVPIAVAMLVMVAWGATPVLTRLATEDLEPLLVAVGRTVLAGVVALPLLVAMRQPLAPPGRRRALLVASSVTGFVVFPLVYTVGQERTSAMHGAVILAALPVFTGLYAALLARRKPTQRWLAGCAVALLGEVVIIGIRVGSSATDPTLLGDLLVLVSGLAVSAGYVAGARLAATGYPSRATTFWGVGLAALVIWPVGAAVLLADGVPHAGAAAWLSVVFLAVVTSIVGYVGWYWALSRGGIVRIGTLQFLQPLSGLTLAALVLDERLTVPMAVGAAAVLTGVTIAQRP
jgi:drug/metabolite transporter (DMT)-like permease